MISKRQAIRNVTAHDMSLPNKQVKKAVKDQYGLTVESNEITAVLGKYADRRFMGKAGQRSLELAGEYLRKIGGDIRQAVRLLHMWQGQNAGEDQAC